MKKLKKNEGITLIKLILIMLLILFTILVVFLAYKLINNETINIEESELNNKIDVFRDWTGNLIRKS